MKPIVLPEEKLDELARNVSSRLLLGQNYNQGIIRGEELQNFSDHQQINKFLLFQVFQAWNMQLSKLKHPYFDFSQNSVQQALSNLRNVLSQNIQITENDFRPMLKSAVYNNLKLLLSPKEAFESFFFPSHDYISLESFEKHVPFFSDMDFIVNSILRYHQKNDFQKIEKGTFFEKMDKVVQLFDSKREVGFDAYRSGLFQKLTQRKIEDIFYELQGVEDRKRVEEEARLRSEREKREAEERARREAEDRARREAEDRARKEAEERERVRREAESAKQSNFFDTVAGNSGDVFDISEELDLPLENEVQEKKFVSPPQSVFPTDIDNDKSNPSTLLDDINSQSTKSPSTIEEAISAFINRDAPQKTVMDGFETPENKEEKPPIYHPPASEEKTTPLYREDPPEKQESSPNFLDKFPKEEEPPQKEQGDLHTVISSQSPDRPQTLAEKLQNQHHTTKVTLNGQHGAEIKLNEIPIHRQYQYVQKVFEGNNVRFRIIVDKVNNAKTKDEVENIIDRFIFSNDKLDKNDDIVREFINMLRNRF